MLLTKTTGEVVEQDASGEDGQDACLTAREAAREFVTFEEKGSPGNNTMPPQKKPNPKRRQPTASPRWLVLYPPPPHPDPQTRKNAIPLAKTNLQRRGTKGTEVSFFALFAPPRCLVPLSLCGVLGKIAVTLSHREHCGHREQAHQHFGSDVPAANWFVSPYHAQDFNPLRSGSSLTLALTISSQVTVPSRSAALRPRTLVMLARTDGATVGLL